MKAVYIPSGTKNLAALFPTVNFNDIEEYIVDLMDITGHALATTTNYLIDSCEGDAARIHFLNKLGGIDAMNFKPITTEHGATSDSSERPTVYPLSKPLHAINRFNVKSNETFTLTSIEYSEADMVWVTELLDAPLAWMEWKGTQGQPDSYLPVVIQDQKFQILKEDERYTYEVTILCILSNTRQNIR